MGNSNDGVEVRLLQSNGVKYPIDSFVWEHAKQLVKTTKDEVWRNKMHFTQLTLKNKIITLKAAFKKARLVNNELDELLHNFPDPDKAYEEYSITRKYYAVLNELLVELGNEVIESTTKDEA